MQRAAALYVAAAFSGLLWWALATPQAFAVPVAPAGLPTSCTTGGSWSGSGRGVPRAVTESAAGQGHTARQLQGSRTSSSIARQSQRRREFLALAPAAGLLQSREAAAARLAKWDLRRWLVEGVLTTFSECVFSFVKQHALMLQLSFAAVSIKAVISQIWQMGGARHEELNQACKRLWQLATLVDAAAWSERQKIRTALTFLQKQMAEAEKAVNDNSPRRAAAALGQMRSRIKLLEEDLEQSANKYMTIGADAQAFKAQMEGLARTAAIDKDFRTYVMGVVFLADIVSACIWAQLSKNPGAVPVLSFVNLLGVAAYVDRQDLQKMEEEYKKLCDTAFDLSQSAQTRAQLALAAQNSLRDLQAIFEGDNDSEVLRSPDLAFTMMQVKEALTDATNKCNAFVDSPGAPPSSLAFEKSS